MHLYRHPVEARTFYAPDVAPSVDASLPIQGVAGLSTLNLPHPASPQSVVSAVHEIQSGGTGPGGAFTASDLRAAYIPGVTLTGAGQSVGLFETIAYNLSDIQAYFSTLGGSLTVPILNVLVDGVSGACGTSCDDTEPALDIEMALALAPGLSAVIVYEGDTPADILNQMATDNLAKQLSCSYVFEADPDLYDPIFTEFQAQGQSFFASSGDGGAYSPPDCVSNCWTSRFPAEDPNVTAVGGTLLTTNGPGGAWLSETTWPDSGGGINSDGYTIASYQTPLINGLNQGSSSLRNIPDVAAVASNVYVQINGGGGSAGGTSASAPLWASFTALVNQQAGGAKVGFLNPLIYPLALTADYANDFHDITSGNNFDSYSPNLFSAVTGYDLATGLGSPNGQDLINALAPVNSGANFTLLSSSPTLTVTQGAQETAQISLQAVNGFSGTVNLGYVVIGQPTGLTASLSQSSISGAAASTLTVSASTAVFNPSVMVAITGTSGGLTQTIYIPVTVLLPNLVETSVSAPPASVTPGATFSLTDTVQNSGQAAAGSSVTGYYLSDSASKNSLSLPVGARNVPALAASATSSATVTVTVPGAFCRTRRTICWLAPTLPMRWRRQPVVIALLHRQQQSSTSRKLRPRRP
jgi:subtilase family serine protease